MNITFEKIDDTIRTDNFNNKKYMLILHEI
jgi:hypothetical protein